MAHWISTQQANNGNTAFFEASHNHHDVAKILLEHGADWSLPNSTGKTALHEVVWAGDNYKPFLQHILEKAKKSSDTQRFKEFLNYRNEIGRTALRVAAEQNRPACVNLLISYNADWSIPGNAKVTALHAACREGHEAVFFLLLQAAQKAGPSQLHDFLDARDDEGRTALSDAVQRDRVKFVKILLGDGARCEIANVRDESALHHASFAGNEVMVMHLLEASSKDPGFLDAKTNQGKTALMNAAEAGSASIIKLLLDKGADYTLICNNGFTALHHCAVRNKRAAVKCLLEITSQDKFTDSDGQQCFEKFLNWQSRIIAVSALCDVAIQGHIEIIDLLLNKYGAAYDRVDSQKCSPLHHAYGRGHSAAAEIILRYAASDTDKQRFRRFVELRDFRDKTVWELAEERKDERWHQLMKECGAAP